MMGTAMTFIGCAVGTLALAMLFRVPKRALLAGMGLGIVAFGVYSLVLSWGGAERLAVFVGAFSGALLAEILARRMCMAAIVFVTPSLLPLVPGLGVYRTMRLVVQGALEEAGALAADTLILLGLLALAVATATLVMRLAWVIPQKIKRA